MGGKQLEKFAGSKIQVDRSFILVSSVPWRAVPRDGRLKRSPAGRFGLKGAALALLAADIHGIGKHSRRKAVVEHKSMLWRPFLAIALSLSYGGGRALCVQYTESDDVTSKSKRPGRGCRERQTAWKHRCISSCHSFVGCCVTFPWRRIQSKMGGGRRDLGKKQWEGCRA